MFGLDFTTLITVLIIDGLSIIFGIFGAIKFARTVINKGDVKKAQGYFYNAFIFIILVPLIFTFFAVRIIPSWNSVPLEGIKLEAVQENSPKNSDERGSITLETLTLAGDEPPSYNIKITNNNNISYNLRVELNCGLSIDDINVCEEMKKSINLPDEIKIPAKNYMRIPVKLVLKDKDYNLAVNITLLDELNNTWGSLALKSVKN